MQKSKSNKFQAKLLIKLNNKSKAKKTVKITPTNNRMKKNNNKINKLNNKKSKNNKKTKNNKLMRKLWTLD